MRYSFGVVIVFVFKIFHLLLKINITINFISVNGLCFQICVDVLNIVFYKT